MLLALTALHVGLVGALAALAAAISSPLSSWLISRQASTSARVLAAEERQYVNRLDTYDEAMKLAYQLQGLAVSALSAFEGKSVAGTLTPVSGDDLAALAGRLEARGSSAAAGCLAALAGATDLFMTAISTARGRGRPPTESERKALYNARDAVTAARVSLGRQVRADLGHP